MVKLELEPRQSNPRIWAPNHSTLYKTLSQVKTAWRYQVSLRVLGEGLSLNFKDTSFNFSGLEVTHEDSGQESKGEVRCVMFSDTKCDVCPSPNGSPILPHQVGVWQFSSILTRNYQELASDSTCLRAQPHKTAPTSEASHKWGVQAVQLLPGGFPSPPPQVWQFPGCRRDSYQTKTKTHFLFQDLLGYWEMLKNCPLMKTSLMSTPLPLGSGMSHTLTGYEWLHRRILVLVWLHSEWRRMETFFSGFGSWVEWLFQSRGPPSFKLPIFLLSKSIRTKESRSHRSLFAWVGISFFETVSLALRFHLFPLTCEAIWPWEFAEA